jgi:RNA polymerase sigma-70 factor, ECF subfamily
MQSDLVERAMRGDRDAFALLATDQVDRLYAIARLVLRDADLAHDAVQEALIRCWRQLPGLQDPDRFEGWLTRIVVRAAADEGKRRRRFENTVQPLAVEATTPDASAALANREQLERGFRRLTVDHRAVVVLHHYLDLPLPAVAGVLGIPVGTAQSRYHYAMAALRAALEADQRPTRQEVPA